MSKVTDLIGIKVFYICTNKYYNYQKFY